MIQYKLLIQFVKYWENVILKEISQYFHKRWLKCNKIMFANAVTLNVTLISYYFQTYITKYNLKIFEKIRVDRVEV